MTIMPDTIQIVLLTILVRTADFNFHLGLEGYNIKSRRGQTFEQGYDSHSRTGRFDPSSQEESA